MSPRTSRYLQIGGPVLVAAVIVSGVVGSTASHHDYESEAVERVLVPPRRDPTGDYLQTMSVTRFERLGSDFTNPRYDPTRIGKPLDEIDFVFDYDQERLDETYRRLEGVDRHRVLREIFRRVCDGCRTDEERHLAVQRFCARASLHNLIQPMHENRTAVFDPLVLLELGEQRCGQTARVAVDLLSAGGFEARLVQVGSHVSAEVHYDGDWHLLEPSLDDGTHVVRDADGTIPSIVELSRRPYAIDALATHVEPAGYSVGNEPMKYSPTCPSYHFFARQAYSTPPLYYVKVASLLEERTSPSFGWRRFVEVPDDERVLGDLPERFSPGAASNLSFDGMHLSWTESADRDDDLLGYRVYLSSRSRGWCYGEGWRPHMYEARFRLPPSDLGVRVVEETRVELPETRPLFVTVVPFDRHGESVGRRLTAPSREFVLQ